MQVSQTGRTPAMTGAAARTSGAGSSPAGQQASGEPDRPRPAWASGSSSPTGLRDRWRALRDRWLSSPVFRRRAAAFWLTRPVARRRAGELFDIVAGFVYSQVLLACVRLDLFSLLAGGPQPATTLAPRLGLSLESAVRLLDAGVALRLVERVSGHRYGLGVLGATLVGNAALTAMVEHHCALYADLADPVALLRRDGGAGELARYWPYAGAADRPEPAAAKPKSTPGSETEPAAAKAPLTATPTTPTVPAPPRCSAGQEAEDRTDFEAAEPSSPRLPGTIADATAAYTALMAASQPLVADEILDAYPLRRHRCLMDVGGGDGSFLTAVASRAPHLRLMLFDLPVVAERAQKRFAAAGLADRATAFGGSFRDGRLPVGADLISLVRVAHDHDDAVVMTLLRASRAALPAGGRLLLAEPMAETPGAERMGDAYFGLYLFAMGSGRPRSAERLTEMLIAAGFGRVRHLATHQPLQTSLLVAEVANTTGRMV